MSVCLPAEHVEAVMQRYRLTEDEDFSGAVRKRVQTLGSSIQLGA